MRRIIEIFDSGTPGSVDVVRLDFDQRNRRRIVFTTGAGKPILLDAQRAVHLRDGQVLLLDDGSSVFVHAVDEELLEIHAHSPAELVRIAWHLGNRHLPTQLVAGENGGVLLIRNDHVIADMVQGLGGHVRRLLAPFDPEGGAYVGGGHGHAHHGQDHDHDHLNHHHHGSGDASHHHALKDQGGPDHSGHHETVDAGG